MKIILKFFIIFFAFTLYRNMCAAQISETNISDSSKAKVLQNVIINSLFKPGGSYYMADVEGTKIFAGKKTNAIMLSDKTDGMPSNLGRTVLAKIPGLNIWEMDGAGTQLNIGSRGTDAHRSVEMNMRQNDYNTNSDLFGYPENHYTVPLQAIQEVQLVRGSAALQFGPQFGGMMNLKVKQGDTTKPVAIETEQTAGPNYFFNSFNAVGGTVHKINYYAFYDNRTGDGWRENAKFNYNAYYAAIGYRLGTNANISFQFSHMDYIQQIAGGLTDAQFNQNQKQSFRSRNFFQPKINIPALIFKDDFSYKTHLEVTSTALFGERNSVQFITTPDIMDTFNTALGSYNKRQVDRDYYNGFTTEARLLHIYKTGKVNSVISGGIRYSAELTRRRQKGMGTASSNFNLSLLNPFGIDLHLVTHNYAAFAENIFQINRQFSVTPGVRYELIDTKMSGVINNASSPVAYKSNRAFPLFGTGLQYQSSSSTQLYGNISQAYRPYLYANVTPATQVDKIDPALKDSKGYDIDLGYRGSYKSFFQFDINAYYLFYGNKVGLLSQANPDGSTYLFTTNIGNSVAKGVEVFGEISLQKLTQHQRIYEDLKLFTSIAYDNAKYTSGNINKGGINTSIKGNYLENTPVWINKTGLEFSHKSFSTNLQFSNSSKSFNDALNTSFSANGVTGIIPSWHVWDWSGNIAFQKIYHVSAGINNLTNKKYFNRRITMYPGPGILPADGRTFYISFGMKM